MSKISNLIEERRLPPLPQSENAEERRKIIVDILSKNIYGSTPKFCGNVSAKQIYRYRTAFGGIAQHLHYDVCVKDGEEEFHFMLALTKPLTEEKVPLMLCVSFETNMPSGFIPIEEIVSKDVALARVIYTDIVADNKESCFSSGAIKLFPRDKSRTDNCGAIGIWAWAASRALDFLLTLGYFDEEKIAVVGHSRLGKTALWCAAQDTRFKYAFSNNAGCSGDAITRGKVGEQISDITKNFPHWFCERYFDFIGEGIENMPFDQHFLLAAISPRKLAIASASLDEWADPQSEYLSCHAASSAWMEDGKIGFVSPDEPLSTDSIEFKDGDIAFRIRPGTHSFCREDWLFYLDFLLK